MFGLAPKGAAPAGWGVYRTPLLYRPDELSGFADRDGHACADGLEDGEGDPRSGHQFVQQEWTITSALHGAEHLAKGIGLPPVPGPLPLAPSI